MIDNATAAKQFAGRCQRQPIWNALCLPSRPRLLLSAGSVVPALQVDPQLTSPLGGSL